MNDLLNSSVCRFISEERRRQQQLQSQLEHRNKMELQRQEQQILQSEEILRNQMVRVLLIPVAVHSVCFCPVIFIFCNKKKLPHSHRCCTEG